MQLYFIIIVSFNIKLEETRACALVGHVSHLERGGIQGLLVHFVSLFCLNKLILYNDNLL